MQKPPHLHIKPHNRINIANSGIKMYSSLQKKHRIARVTDKESNKLCIEPRWQIKQNNINNK